MILDFLTDQLQSDRSYGGTALESCENKPASSGEIK